MDKNQKDKITSEVMKKTNDKYLNKIVLDLLSDEKKISNVLLIFQLHLYKEICQIYDNNKLYFIDQPIMKSLLVVPSDVIPFLTSVTKDSDKILKSIIYTLNQNIINIIKSVYYTSFLISKTNNESKNEITKLNENFLRTIICSRVKELLFDDDNLSNDFNLIIKDLNYQYNDYKQMRNLKKKIKNVITIDEESSKHEDSSKQPILDDEDKTIVNEDNIPHDQNE
jgi:hypothetical protein